MPEACADARLQRDPPGTGAPGHRGTGAASHSQSTSYPLEAYSTAFCIKLVIARAKFAGSSGKLPSATSA